jgi:hypothetical protein
MKKALVVGSAPCVFEDLFDAPKWPKIVVNWAGIRHLGPIEFWASLHRHLIYEGIKIRRDKGGDMAFTAWAKAPAGERVPNVPSPTKMKHYINKWGAGSSGWYAIEVALKELGYDRLILCGIPMTGETTIQKAGIEERIRNDEPFIETLRPRWSLHMDKLQGKVKSMSGWTRELLGGPEDW